MIRIALALMLLAAPVSAKNGEFLNAMCQSVETNEFGLGYCIGAIDSIRQVMEAGNSINGMEACFPTDFNMESAMDTVKRYLENSEPGSKLNLQKYNVASAVALIFMVEFRCD